MKSIIAAGILLASGSAASAIPLITLPFNISIEHGAAFNIRRCPVDGDETKGVCYNEIKTVNLGVYSFDKERAYSIDCTRRFHSSATTRGKVAKEFCPIRADLNPAPFLM